VPEPSANATVARASGIMVLALLLSRVLGILRETVIAYKFGQGAEADMFRAAFSIPDLLFFLIAGGALSSAFIPIFSEYLHTDREKEAWELFSVVTTIVTATLIVVVIVTEVFAAPLVRIGFPGFTPDQVATTAYLSRIILPAQIAFFVGGITLGTFYARHQVLVPALGPNIYNIGIIAGALFLAPLLTPPISGLVWGALAGAVVGNLLIPFFVLARTGGQFRAKFDIRNPQFLRVAKLMLPVVLGLSLPGVYPLIVRSMASVDGPGAIAAIDNANRIMQAPLGIFGQALGLAVFGTLAMYAAQKQMELFSSTLQRSLRVVLFLTLPAAAFMIVMPDEIVRLLLQYGRFKPGDTERAADALRLYAIGIPAWSAQAILMRGYFALQDIWTPIGLGTLTTAVFIPTSLLLQRGPLGTTGLALGVSIGAVLLFVMMSVSLLRKTKSGEGRRLMGMLAGGSISAAIGSLVGMLTAHGLTALLGHAIAQPNLLAAVSVFGGLFTLVITYLLVARLLGMEETKYAITMITSRLRKRTDEGA